MMDNKVVGIKSETESLKHTYTPLFFRTGNQEDKKRLEQLISENKVSFIHDNIEGQLRELIKCRYLGKKLKDSDYHNYIEKHLGGKSLDEFGVWIYYPWNRRLVHSLDKAEFVEIRTNRNQYKITRDERDVLATKKIGIIGLSVGQSVALTLAMERGFGELVLADFDFLELSNLNRIRTGIHNLGEHKAVIAAREIAEIDPFLKVICFIDGVTEDNIEDFFTLNGKLDLLIEECDGLDMKIIARLKARELGIPVLMDTSDRGMLDVERFDLDSARPILHGLIENMNFQDIKKLSDEDKVPIILQMLGLDSISVRGRVSMIEVNQSINTWPQLASSVALGGALVTDVSRRILLNQFSESGRYYIDFEGLVADKSSSNMDNEPFVRNVPVSPMTVEEMNTLASLYTKKDISTITPDQHTITSLVNAACAAPSTGNDQPWKWLYTGGTLYLFHDEYRSNSFGDFQKIASFITLGAAYENLYIHAITQFGIEPDVHFFPLGSNERLVAAIGFKQYDKKNSGFVNIEQLDGAITKRHTNRNLSAKVELDSQMLNDLKSCAESINGATLQWLTSDTDMLGLSEIIGKCDKMRILNDEGHYDFVHREMRWTQEDSEKTRDGIFVNTLGLTQSQLSALKVIKSTEVIKNIRAIGGGGAFEALARRSVSCASALCLITLPKYSLQSFFDGGRSMERFWLAATNLNLAVHPLISPLYLFPRILHADSEGLSEKDAIELAALRDKFLKLVHTNDDMAEVFIAKIAVAEEPTLKALRLPIEKVLFFND
jgi:molybdopterin/thiamine biosynthesis adenylyltransferase